MWVVGLLECCAVLLCGGIGFYGHWAWLLVSFVVYWAVVKFIASLRLEYGGFRTLVRGMKLQVGDIVFALQRQLQ